MLYCTGVLVTSVHGFSLWRLRTHRQGSSARPLSQEQRGVGIALVVELGVQGPQSEFDLDLFDRIKSRMGTPKSSLPL